MFIQQTNVYCAPFNHCRSSPARTVSPGGGGVCFMCPQCARHCGGALRVHLILRISLRGILRRFLGECRHDGLRAPLDGTLCIAAQPRTLPGRCPPLMSPELHLFPLLPRRCDSKPQCLTQVPSRPGCSSARAAAAALHRPLAPAQPHQRARRQVRLGGGARQRVDVPGLHGYAPSPPPRNELG